MKQAQIAMLAVILMSVSARSANAIGGAHPEAVRIDLDSNSALVLVGQEEDNQFVYDFKPFTSRTYLFKKSGATQTAVEVDLWNTDTYHYQAFLDDYSLGRTDILAFSALNTPSVPFYWNLSGDEGLAYYEMPAPGTSLETDFAVFQNQGVKKTVKVGSVQAAAILAPLLRVKSESGGRFSFQPKSVLVFFNRATSPNSGLAILTDEREVFDEQQLLSGNHLILGDLPSSLSLKATKTHLPN